MPARTSTRNSKAPAKQETEYGEKVDGSIVGNLTRDPDLRFTSGGRPVASFSIAVNEKVKNEDTGEWEETETEFFDCNAWGTLAENICENLTRGARVVATGYYQEQTFTTRDGDRRTKNTFTAKDLGPSMLWHGAQIIKAHRS